jgi:hypothetical protein
MDTIVLFPQHHGWLIECSGEWRSRALIDNIQKLQNYGLDLATWSPTMSSSIIRYVSVCMHVCMYSCLLCYCRPVSPEIRGGEGILLTNARWCRTEIVTENWELESSTKSQTLLSNLQSSLVPETFCFVKKTRKTEEFSNVIFFGNACFVSVLADP